MHNLPYRLFAIRHHLLITFTLAVVLAGTAWAYAPGLSGAFVFDDLINITENTAVTHGGLDQSSLARAAFSRGTILSSRPISMVTFSINHYFSGLDPFAYKLTNLVIHLLNGLCIYALTRLVLTAYGRRYNRALGPGQIQALAVVVSAAWLLHPINLTDVLYVVQRMNSLATLFVLLGLICYMRGRLRLDAGRGGTAWILAGFIVFTPLALLSKENGALLPLYAFVLEISLFRFHCTARRGRQVLAGVFTVFLLLPLLAVLASLIVDPGWLLGGYAHRPFTLGQRLLTEARALWFYLFITFVPDIREMGLFHDDFTVSHGLLTPATTLPAVLGIAGLAVTAFLCRRRAPLVTLGILFFLAGHSMESTIIPLELVYEHRNYLPVYGVLLPLFYYLAYPLQRWNPFRLRHAAAVLTIALFTFATTVRAAQWGNGLTFAVAEVAHHPRSPRANTELGRVFYVYVKEGVKPREKYFKLARRYFARSTLINKQYAVGLFGMIVLYGHMDRPLPRGIVGMLAHRLRVAPFSNNSSNLLSQLISCQERDVCRLSKADLGRIVQAALNNKTLGGRNKASVLTSASRYFGLYNNYPAAVHFSREAAKALPGDLQYRLNVVYWLIGAGRLDQAQRSLNRIKAMDTFNRHAGYIASQEKRLRDARLIRDISGGDAPTGSGPHGPQPPQPMAPPAEKN